MKLRRQLLFLFVCCLCSINSYSQRSNKYLQTPRDRSYIKQMIQEWGSCRNVAITSYGGDLALNEDNAYASTGIPQSLTVALEELNKNGEFIDDVQLTETGRWLILYGNNGFRWNNIPKSLEHKMREFNRKQEIVTSVAFNDRGDWIIISQNLVSSSSSKLQDELKNAINMYGQLWAAHLTNRALALCFENGYHFIGDVPKTLKLALRKSRINVFRLKFTEDGAYFFADKYGYYQAHM